MAAGCRLKAVLVRRDFFVYYHKTIMTLSILVPGDYEGLGALIEKLTDVIPTYCF